MILPNMRTRSLSTEELKKGIMSGSTVALAKAITLVESQIDSDQDQAAQLIESLLPYTGKSTRVAISGVPGVGKSTFIEALGIHLTQQQHKVAVLAIDPSSTMTHGSILGDKTRMEKLSKDPNAFVRPTATSGHLGGVAGRTREAILLCEAAGFNLILIETVGVGQSEIAVRGMVDYVLLLMLAGAGDELQGIKKGILEIADGIAINKADGDNIPHVNRARAELQHALHLVSSTNAEGPTIMVCSAIENSGIGDIWKNIESFRVRREQDGSWQARRQHQQLTWLEESLRELALKKVQRARLVLQSQIDLEQKVANAQVYPPTAAVEVWNELLKHLR